ncbi:nuclear transport factor 2 family protein [Sphingomonas radiodurans]|uniref:nuclear transport factor 2 family protein n=1 Tax=Sphingomonas radiodurans TaxID=2890321 RepID=UPI001E381A9B|nr:nuclear transport factor 2 family protein [Sphingomonas radiodurans]WBH15689.1 nuclear transport factor 2 family protein [Sphingomonas radiodurans]
MIGSRGAAWLLGVGLLAAGPAEAEWKAATPTVAAAAKSPEVAAALAAVEKLDAAVISNDHAAFAALLTPDLVVNNPQNSISDGGATARLNASGRISYVSYDRTLDYAGVRNGMVVLMGDELVVARPPNPAAGVPVRRRFTDLWRKDGGQWRLALRQATIVSAR